MCSFYHFDETQLYIGKHFHFGKTDIIAHFPTLYDNPRCYKYVASSCRRNLIE